jgi:catechol 2,3-dioxygenase-like lactoylglutathione lyase family enzyme
MSQVQVGTRWQCAAKSLIDPVGFTKGGHLIEVRNIRWVGVATEAYDEMRVFLSDVMGLRVGFEEPTTVEFATTEGDELQIMRPGDPYFAFFYQHAHGPVPLFEVVDLDAAVEELVAANIEIVGQRGRDRRWDWIHFRAPDGNLYELSCRRDDLGTA